MPDFQELSSFCAKDWAGRITGLNGGQGDYPQAGFEAAAVPWWRQRCGHAPQLGTQGQRLSLGIWGSQQAPCLQAQKGLCISHQIITLHCPSPAILICLCLICHPSPCHIQTDGNLKVRQWGSLLFLQILCEPVKSCRCLTINPTEVFNPQTGFTLAATVGLDRKSSNSAKASL